MSDRTMFRVTLAGATALWVGLSVSVLGSFIGMPVFFVIGAALMAIGLQVAIGGLLWQVWHW